MIPLSSALGAESRWPSMLNYVGPWGSVVTSGEYVGTLGKVLYP